MTYLLDTNTCIKYLNGISGTVKSNFEKHTIFDIYLCSVVKAELFYGAGKSRNPAKNLEKINDFFYPFISLPFDDKAAIIYGNIKTELTNKGTPIGPNDLLIASIALSNNAILVTHNTREFKRVPSLQLEDWEL